MISLHDEADDRARRREEAAADVYVLSPEAQEFIAEHGTEAYVADVFARKGKGKPGDGKQRLGA